MMRRVLFAVLAVSLCAVAFGQPTSPPPVSRAVTPVFTDAGYLTSLLWRQDRGEKELRHYFPHFAANLVYKSVAALPGADRTAIQGSCAWSYTQGCDITGDPGIALMRRPELMVCQNAILLTGSDETVGQAEALIREYDMPRPGVSFEVMLIDLPAKQVAGWALDWVDMPDLAAESSLINPRGPGAYVRGHIIDTEDVKMVPVMRYAIDDSAVFGPAMAGQLGIAESAFVVDRAQGIFALGESVPIAPSYACCELMHGGCTQGYCSMCRTRGTRLPWAIFQGVELWLRPSIQPDGHTSILLRPRLTEWAGRVNVHAPAPIVPITRYQPAMARLDVMPGQSIIISGLARDRYMLNHELMGSVRLHARNLARNPVIIITPRIVVPASV